MPPGRDSGAWGSVMAQGFLSEGRETSGGSGGCHARNEVKGAAVAVARWLSKSKGRARFGAWGVPSGAVTVTRCFERVWALGRVGPVVCLSPLFVAITR